MADFKKTDKFLFNNLDETKKYRIYRNEENCFVKTLDFLGVMSGQKFINLYSINMDYFFIGNEDGTV